VISDDGTVLEPYVARRFVSLPLVVGKGAETRAKDFPEPCWRSIRRSAHR